MKRRVTFEAYLTSPQLAQRCVLSVDQRYGLNSFELIVEPSAGDGVFLDLLPKRSRIGIDVNPMRVDLLAEDFLQWRPTDTHRTLVIGNPPFGQRGALAIRFIKHAAQFADVIAFILPRSFNKDTFQNRVPENFILKESFDCDDDFLIDGRPRSVKTVFQIWERSETSRVILKRPNSHPHFEMRHAHLSRLDNDQLSSLRQEFRFTIPQVGSFAPRPAAEVTQGSHWFIKPLVASVEKVFENLNFDFLEGMNTAHMSLAKADIVQAYQLALSVDPELHQAIEREIDETIRHNA